MAVFLTKMRDALSAAGIDKETIAVLVQWSEQYLDMGTSQDPNKLGRKSVEQFLRYLINDRGVTRTNQDIALEAVRMLHKVARGEVPEWMDEIIAERRVLGAATVLSYAEVRRLLTHIYALEDWLMAGFIYGSGLRLLECVQLRVRDLDLNKNQVAVRDSYDRVERWAPLATNIREKLDPYLEKKRQKHIQDIIKGGGLATLPPKIAANRPEVSNNWGWQYIFAEDAMADYKPRLVDQALDHIDPEIFRQSLERAAVEAYIFRQLDGTSLRNSFASHISVRNISELQIQQILGKKKPPMHNDEPIPVEVTGLYLPIEPPKNEVTFSQ